MVSKRLLSLHKDSLFRNSFYLMLTTAVVSGFGFIFWLLAAHLYPTNEIGLATALISSLNLIAILSLVGFNTVFVRFLSRSTTRDADMSTGMLLVAAVALVLGALFALFVPVLSPKLAFVHEPLVGVAFAVFSVFTALNMLIESIFLALRSTQYKLLNSTIYSVVKILLPFAFVGWGPLGIFSAAALAQALGAVLGIAFLVRSFQFRPRLTLDREIIRRNWRYSAVNYTAAIFNLLPISLLPLIITNRLDAESAAYFYLAMMIGNLLYVVPWSAASSLFAEGAHDEEHLRTHVSKAVRINFFLLTPAIVLTLLLAKFVLHFFGTDYAAHATFFLWQVALAAIPIAVNSTFGALLQIKKDPRSLVITNIFYGTVILGLTYAFMPLGLTGIGYAWIIGNCTAALVSGSSYFWGERFYARLTSGTHVPRLIVRLKVMSLVTRLKRGGRTPVILCYPERPRWYHVTYVLAHWLGYRISTDPRKPFDMAISFEDATFKRMDETVERLRETTTFVNGRCMDISKQTVDEIHGEVFGYRMGVDPRTHVGQCVRKSDINATHDGCVITCPAEPEAGYVYQKLIDNTWGEDSVRDIRAIIYRGTIPFIINRYRSVHDRFDNTQSIRIAQTHETFSAAEVEKLLAFSERLGLDYGELDVLRDNRDGTIYVVDANLTCGGPVCGVHLTKSEYWQFVRAHAAGFASLFKAVQ